MFEEDKDQLIDIYDVKVVLFWLILSKTLNRTLIEHFIFPCTESSNREHCCDVIGVTLSKSNNY